jgi:phosphoribosyl 1,2-cyclic phosphodiesterase
MRVRFWGTRGSIPVAPTSRDIRDRLVRALVAGNGHDLDTAEKAHAFAREHLDFATTHTYGGYSSCVEFEPGGGEYYVCDMGSGARPFGAHVFARQAGKPGVVNVFQSHPHWDHIMGFPFFGPAYVPGWKIRIHGCHEYLERAYRLQHDPMCFPVTFDQFGASIEFVPLVPGATRTIGGVQVTPMLQTHSGDSYGYRFEAGGCSFVYSTDSEHKLEDPAATNRFIDFFRDADLVVFDAMYSLADAISVKADWGHSSNIIGVELCQRAKARRLALFHHEPANSDASITQILRETQRFEEITQDGHRVEVLASYDGLEIEL